MSRVKRGVTAGKKHKKLLELTKGHVGLRSRAVRVAKQASLHAGAYAFHGRKLKRRDLRSLWIVRISEAVKRENLSYSVFINKLKKAKIELDRKILSNLVVEDPTVFKYVVEHVKRA